MIRCTWDSCGEFIISVPYGQSAPAGYSLYQQGTPKEFGIGRMEIFREWRESTNQTYDGVEIVGNNILAVAGKNEKNGSIAMVERYEVSSNSWTTV